MMIEMKTNVRSVPDASIKNYGLPDEKRSVSNGCLHRLDPAVFPSATLCWSSSSERYLENHEYKTERYYVKYHFNEQGMTIKFFKNTLCGYAIKVAINLWIRMPSSLPLQNDLWRRCCRRRRRGGGGRNERHEHFSMCTGLYCMGQVLQL